MVKLIKKQKVLYSYTIEVNIMKIKRKVWVNKANGQKLITIPYDSNIEKGDYVWIEKATK